MRELTPNEYMQIESQMANMEVALQRANEFIDRCQKEHIATPTLHKVAEVLSESMVETIAEAGQMTLLWNRLGIHSNEQAEKELVSQSDLAMTSALAIAYLAGYEMGKTNNPILEYRGVCLHGKDAHE